MKNFKMNSKNKTTDKISQRENSLNQMWNDRRKWRIFNEIWLKIEIEENKMTFQQTKFSESDRKCRISRWIRLNDWNRTGKFAESNLKWQKIFISIQRNSIEDWKMKRDFNRQNLTRENAGIRRTKQRHFNRENSLNQMRKCKILTMNWRKFDGRINNDISTEKISQFSSRKMLSSERRKWCVDRFDGSVVIFVLYFQSFRFSALWEIVGLVFSFCNCSFCWCVCFLFSSRKNFLSLQSRTFWCCFIQL